MKRRITPARRRAMRLAESEMRPYLEDFFRSLERDDEKEKPPIPDTCRITISSQ